MIAAYNYIIIKLLNKKSVNKMLNIPEYYPNTQIERNLG